MAMIGVLGATGRTGGATVRALRRRGEAVRALVRRTDGAAARELKALGAEVVRADQDEVDSLRVALAGCERVFNVQAAFDQRVGISTKWKSARDGTWRRPPMLRAFVM